MFCSVDEFKSLQTCIEFQRYSEDKRRPSNTVNPWTAMTLKNKLKKLNKIF